MMLLYTDSTYGQCIYAYSIGYSNTTRVTTLSYTNSTQHTETRYVSGQTPTHGTTI